MPKTLVPHPAVVEKWNSTAAAYPDRSTIVDLVDRAAAEHHDRPAVRTALGGVELTHGRLRARSAELARKLAALGVGRGTYVAVLADHVPEAVVAFHAILRAGGTYIPLDSRWPVRRSADVLGSLPVRIILVTAGFEGTAFELGSAVPGLEEVVVVDGPPRAPAPDGSQDTALSAATLPAADSLVGSGPGPDDLAYVIFTSGTTGTPKGVAVSHRSVVNLFHWFNRRHDVRVTDVLLQVATFSFDLSVYDLFGVIAAGGSVLLLPAAELAEPVKVARALLGHGVTLWNSAPAAFTVVLLALRLLGSEGRGALRRVFLSGDWIPLTTPHTLAREFPSAVLVALGGATEACVWSNDFVVEAVDPSWCSIPYGHPMTNARYYVLREDLSPCAVGEPGELYIAGVCVAVGYVNDAGLTAARFLPDPWHGEPGARMYRTGDRARWTASGWVEFLGRLDSQVKVRGYRIELAELEHAAVEAAGVSEAVAVTVGKAQDPVLAMAVRAPAELGADEVRARLAVRLPTYMIPTRVLVMDTLPVGANGKVDRAAVRGLLAGANRNPEPADHKEEEV